MRISFIIVALFLLSGCETLDYVSVGAHSNNHNYRVGYYDSHYRYNYLYSYPYYSSYTNYNSRHNYWHHYRPRHHVRHHAPKHHETKKNHQLRDRRKHDSNTHRPRRP